MTLSDTKPDMKLSPEQFRSLRDIIYEKSGIFFTENKTYLLENRLGRRIKELEMTSFDNYIGHIKTQPSGSPEYHQIYNAITINETFFFRYMAQLDAFRQLLKNIIHTRGTNLSPTIRIWSAASSTGEEPYTIAIMLDELLGNQRNKWTIELVGTDISHRALKLAKTAFYTRNSFRGGMTESQKQKYFTPEGNGFTLKPEIRDMVEYRYLNLNDRMEIRKFGKMDFVFCRNVLIYFDEDMKKRVLRSIYDVMDHGGYFFLGEAESLHGISSSFKVEHFAGAFAYNKE